MYHYSRMGVLSNYIGRENLSQSHVCFRLPRMEKLSAVIEDRPVSVLLVSCGMYLFLKLISGCGIEYTLQ